MADISKCAGRDCEVRENCYRYTAPENEYRQSWIAPPVTGAACGFYWPTSSVVEHDDDDEGLTHE